MNLKAVWDETPYARWRARILRCNASEGRKLGAVMRAWDRACKRAGW